MKWLFYLQFYSACGTVLLINLCKGDTVKADESPKPWNWHVFISAKFHGHLFYSYTIIKELVSTTATKIPYFSSFSSSVGISLNHRPWVDCVVIAYWLSLLSVLLYWFRALKVALLLVPLCCCEFEIAMTSQPTWVAWSLYKRLLRLYLSVPCGSKA